MAVNLPQTNVQPQTQQTGENNSGIGGAITKTLTTGAVGAGAGAIVGAATGIVPASKKAVTKEILSYYIDKSATDLPDNIVDAATEYRTALSAYNSAISNNNLCAVVEKLNALPDSAFAPKKKILSKTPVEKIFKIIESEFEIKSDVIKGLKSKEEAIKLCESLNGGVSPKKIENGVIDTLSKNLDGMYGKVKTLAEDFVKSADKGDTLLKSAKKAAKSVKISSNIRTFASIGIFSALLMGLISTFKTSKKAE